MITVNTHLRDDAQAAALSEFVMRLSALPGGCARSAGMISRSRRTQRAGIRGSWWNAR
jgi:hypothetical protein